MSDNNHKNQVPEHRIPRPSDIMRARRPELFSDTSFLKTPFLSKSILEYHLHTLTSRKQELAFEEFCRRLAELEICPNLKPQTGPSGGGDSGVDSSTYPVAPDLAERCYWGTPSPTFDEAWAFAFSCKKMWKDKVKQDAEKIARLDRKFEKVYFISNQQIRDKVRAEIETELTKKHGFELHILDHSWIVSRIIDHKREDIAIDTLGIQVSESQRPQLGARDAVRQQKLDSLLKKLGQPENYHGNDYALAQDYLTAGKLARGLGRPRHEVDGFFDRARTLARKVGYVGQIIKCGYTHAWTSYCWFDDSVSLEMIYSDIEGHLPTTNDAHDSELFVNLWLLLCREAKSGTIPLEKARLVERLSNIRMQLERLSREELRPNNALHAETLLYFLDLIEGIEKSKKVEHVFDDLEKCLKKAENLGTYPVMKFISTLSEMGNLFGHLPGYDSLFIEMKRIAGNRFGEISEGELLYKRGMQLIETGELSGALSYLGQAQMKLSKRETMQNSIRASLGCSHVYSGMGLYWAARMEALTAAHRALRSMEAVYEFPMEGILASVFMGWLELRLGRLAPFMAWYNLSWILFEHLHSMQYDVEQLEEELRQQEGVFGCFLLNMKLEDVKKLAELQHGFERANLSIARWALLYSQGEIDTLVKELPEHLKDDRKELEEFFLKWKTQPASEQMPDSLYRPAGTYQEFETTTMNVSYCIRASDNFGPIVFAENLIGVIEAALALAKWENLAFIVDEVKVFIDIDTSGNNPPLLNLETPPDSEGYSLVWKPDMLEWLNTADRKEVHDFLMRFLLKLLLDITIDPIVDIEQELNQWHEEGAFSRAIGMSPTSIALTNIIGEEQYELRFRY